MTAQDRASGGPEQPDPERVLTVPEVAQELHARAATAEELERVEDAAEAAFARGWNALAAPGGFNYDAPLRPCRLCGEPCCVADEKGRPVHPTCWLKAGSPA